MVKRVDQPREDLNSLTYTGYVEQIEVRFVSPWGVSSCHQLFDGPNIADEGRQAACIPLPAYRREWRARSGPSYIRRRAPLSLAKTQHSLARFAANALRQGSISRSPAVIGGRLNGASAQNVAKLWEDGYEGAYFPQLVSKWERSETSFTYRAIIRQPNHHPSQPKGIKGTQWRCPLLYRVRLDHRRIACRIGLLCAAVLHWRRHCDHGHGSTCGHDAPGVRLWLSNFKCQHSHIIYLARYRLSG